MKKWIIEAHVLNRFIFNFNKKTYMSNPSQFYLKHINATSSGFRATWDPGLPLKIGDIVKLDSFGAVNVYNSLEKVGIVPEVRTDESTTDLDYSSGSGITITVKGAGAAPVTGSVLTDADAGFNLQFTTEKSIVFKIAGYKTHQIINLGEIESFLLAKNKNGDWDKSWLIVTHLIVADTATIIIADKGNASIDLHAKAAVGAAQLKITDASLGLTVARETGSTVNFIAQNGLTPLYKVMGLKSPFFGKTHLDVRELSKSKENESLSFMEVGLDSSEPDMLTIEEDDL
jgi:hypothetical protein